MKPFLRTALVAALLLAPVPAFAQTESTDVTTDTTTASTTADRNNDFDWGWLGLIGLAGLAGLRRRDDRPYPTAATSTDRR